MCKDMYVCISISVFVWLTLDKHKQSKITKNKLKRIYDSSRKRSSKKFFFLNICVLRFSIILKIIQRFHIVKLVSYLQEKLENDFQSKLFRGLLKKL